MEILLPENKKTLGVLAYTIISNNQVHNYQTKILEEYLCSHNYKMEDTVMADILDGKETALSLSKSLEAFNAESREIQSGILYMSCVLANVDGYTDKKEDMLIKSLVKNSKLNRETVDEIYELAKEEAQQIRNRKNTVFSTGFTEETGSVIKKFKNYIKSILTRRKQRKEIESIEKYKKAIEKCSKIAAEDFSVVKPIYLEVTEECKIALDEMKTLKNAMRIGNGIVHEVAKLIDSFVKNIEQNVEAELRRSEESLFQKEQTLTDFTISLVGRTKSGKSTLHSILTKTGEEKIGVGSQRTTRYNRVFQWNLLRIIDTPGIGSPEANGRSDDEIALSVLGESDIVCMVVVDDSILQDVFEFMDKVAKLNKPIIILLNHKENIRPEVKFKRYIADPKKWLTTQDESNLNGHINRIKKYAEEKGYSKRVKIYPVFLLGALMANEAQYSKYSKILWEGSNIEAFVDQLQNWITKSGALKRSQTILDETMQVFKNSLSQIQGAQFPVDAQLDLFQKRKNKDIEKLENRQKQESVILKKSLEKLFEELSNEKLLVFAEENYKVKKDLGGAWENYIKEIGFEDELRDLFEKHYKTFSKEVEEILEEILADMQYTLELSLNVGYIKNSISFDKKGFLNILGSVLDVVGAIVGFVLGASNPIGWILMGAGILMNVFALFTKSKAERRQEAIDKIYGEIKSKIDETAPEYIEGYMQNFDTDTQKQIEQVETLYEELIRNLTTLQGISQQTIEMFESSIKLILSAYAKRIIEFLEENSEKQGLNGSNSIVNVFFAESGELCIEMSKKRKFKTEVLEEVISEEVLILKKEF